MKEILQILASHLMCYPGMMPQDCIKLLFQNEMGGGHFIEDKEAFARRFQDECALDEVRRQGTHVPEYIGNGLYRVHLSELQGLEPGTMAALSARSAQKCVGSRDVLQENLQELCRWARTNPLPFSQEEIVVGVEKYIAADCPAGSHSERYRGLYKPHYRILDAVSTLFLPVFMSIDRAMRQKSYILVGVEGMSGAGKSALAALLQCIYGCGVVHTDDFFLQPHQRTEERLAIVGGNIDYERLIPVLQKATSPHDFVYQAYDCQMRRMGEWKDVPQTTLRVVEGVYAMHPKLNVRYDVRVFLAVDADVQASRIGKRSGEDLAKRFKDEWIPMENQYFGEFLIREGCDVCIDTRSL